MAGGKDLEICVPKETYLPGETVEGYLAVSLHEAMELRVIQVKFVGHAHVSWSTGTGSDRKSYSDTEQYFKEKQILLDSGTSSDKNVFELQPGTYTYPFRFQLPVCIPPSYLCRDGYVKYWIEAKIKRPLAWDMKRTLFYDVGSREQLDLSLDPGVLQSANGQSSTTLCCLCCKSGPIAASLWINKRGFLPGENIVVNAEVDNKSNRTMSKSEVVLHKASTLRAIGDTKTEHEMLSRIRKDSIPPGESDVYSGLLLAVPPGTIASSSMAYCQIIDIQYTVTVCCSLSIASICILYPLYTLTTIQLALEDLCNIIKMQQVEVISISRQ